MLCLIDMWRVEVIDKHADSEGLRRDFPLPFTIMSCNFASTSKQEQHNVVFDGHVAC